MLEMFRGATLIAATLTAGLLAGLFFAVAIMIGLHRVDDRTFIGAMQQINVGIQNGWFLISFLGAPVLAALAVVLHVSAGHRHALPWVAVGFVLAAATFIITVAINVPLNNVLDVAGEPDQITDLAAVRASFEAAWVRWNVIRTVTSTAAFACLSWALILYSRATTPS
jgi:uncharacterized membrane protein